MTCLAVPGILSARELDATVESIVAMQLPSGMIPWYVGGHADSWNHTEAAMALLVGGRRVEADRAYQWLVDNQRADGSWHAYYLPDRIEDAKLDANNTAYPATGVWHHWLLTGDRGFLETMWKVVEPAIDFVLDLQTPRGEIRWARHADGTPWPFALLTGSSSISHSLRCAIAIAEELGHERPDWELSLDLLLDVIRNVPHAFEPKHRWAMDWYYPVLSGAVRGQAARERMEDGWSTFVLEGRGTRCVSDREWVTAAETCESVMAFVAAGECERGADLFRWAQALRDDDGAYFTGLAFPDAVHFPAQERSAYTAAAVVLAADALTGWSPASGLFTELATLPPVPSGEPADESVAKTD